MIIIPFTIATIMNCLSVYLNYTEFFPRDSWQYYSSAAVMGAINTCMWFLITALQPQTNKIYTNGIIYDSTIILVYLLFPLLITSVSLSGKAIAGIILMMIGAILTKV